MRENGTRDKKQEGESQESLVRSREARRRKIGGRQKVEGKKEVNRKSRLREDSREKTESQFNLKK